MLGRPLAWAARSTRCSLSITTQATREVRASKASRCTRTSAARGTIRVDWRSFLLLVAMVERLEKAARRAILLDCAKSGVLCNTLPSILRRVSTQYNAQQFSVAVSLVRECRNATNYCNAEFCSAVPANSAFHC